MPVIDNKKYFSAIELQYDKLSSYLADELVTAPFCNDFIYRFCWSTNSLEGNTLTLDDTISVLDYDEVRGGHKYEEYHDAKQQHKAILQMLIPLQKRKITEEWIKDGNGRVGRMILNQQLINCHMLPIAIEKKAIIGRLSESFSRIMIPPSWNISFVKVS